MFLNPCQFRFALVPKRLLLGVEDERVMRRL